MKEEDIRPGNLVRDRASLSREDVERVLEHRNEFVDIACPACESSNRHVIFEKNNFTFVSCNSCETVYVSPRPTPKMLAEHYTTSKSLKFWNEKIFPASEDVRRAQIFAPRAKLVAELCEAYNTERTSLLDVGAGFGTFCEEIEKLNFFNRIVAVEPSKSLAQTCRLKGLDVIEKPIEEIEMDGVSVVTNFELIEHLFSPKDFVTACARVLPKDGLFIITTPNIKGFDLLVLGKASNTISGLNHINYFHPKSLTHLLERCGFDVIRILTPGKLDAELVRKKILCGDFDISNQPFLKHILIDRWETVGESFQQFLANNLLSSHLWMVAKKR